MARQYNRQFKKYQTHGRFVVERIGGKGEGWNLIDNLDGFCLEFETRVEAIDAKMFAIEYIKRYGDIDLGMFPYTLETPLMYCEDRYPIDGAIEAYSPRPWNIADKKGWQ